LQPGGGELLAETTLWHSHDESFRARLPIRLGLVRLDSGPTAVVFLHDRVGLGGGVTGVPVRVRIGTRLDKAGQGVLVAFPEGDVAQSAESETAQSAHLREMTCDPRGRRVLICDAGNALGVALVRALVDAGAEVVWAACNPSMAPHGDLGDLLGELEQVQLVSLDLTSQESVDSLASQIGAQVDVLINNTESYGPDLARAFGPAMRTRAAGVPVGTPAMAWVNLLTFPASKSAAYSFCRSLRAEMLPSGVRTVNVFPGPVGDDRNRELPALQLAPAAVAGSIVRALRAGVEDWYPDELPADR
jgi:NAD(P)-dependent dehydrogenase (short-subunit alcohol dehydrogenase family)